MKNKRLIKILAAIASCLLLVGAVIGISVAAEETAPAIEYKNLAYEGAVHIVYYVNTNNLPGGYTVKLATWTEADESDLVEKEAESFTKFVGETEYTVFASKGIAPKKMRDTVYAQTVLYNAEEVVVARGEVVEYSIYTYVKNRVFKGCTADQKALYHALVDYGASVQKALGYKTSLLANDMFMDYSKLNIVEPKTTTLYLNYDEIAGIWSKGNVESYQYIVEHGSAPHTELGLDGNSFTYTKPMVIKSISGNGDTITWNNVEYRAGSVIPKGWLGLGFNGGEVAFNLTAPTKTEYTTVENLISVIDTTINVTEDTTVDGTNRAVHIYVTNTSNVTSTLSSRILAQFGIVLKKGNYTICKIGGASYTGTTAAATCDYGVDVSLRIEAYETVDDKVLLKQFINGTEVASVETAPSAEGAVDGIAPKALRFVNTSEARNLKITFTDTTFAHYSYLSDN